jgi:hypothetical protein
MYKSTPRAKNDFNVFKQSNAKRKMAFLDMFTAGEFGKGASICSSLLRSGLGGWGKIPGRMVCVLVVAVFCTLSFMVLWMAVSRRDSRKELSS